MYYGPSSQGLAFDKNNNRVIFLKPIYKAVY